MLYERILPWVLICLSANYGVHTNIKKRRLTENFQKRYHLKVKKPLHTEDIDKT